jgi:hypothetical protein
VPPRVRATASACRSKSATYAVRALASVAPATRTGEPAVVKEDGSEDQSDRQDAEDVDGRELES